MKDKKNPKYNLEKKRILFLQFGLIFSFMLVLSAFEYKAPTEQPKDISFDIIEEIDLLVPVTFREPEKPKEVPEIKKIDLLKPILINNCEDDDPFTPSDSFDNPDEAIVLKDIEETIEDCTDEVPFYIVEEMPIFNPQKNNNFKEGNKDLFKTLQSTVKYPLAAQEACIEGRVFVRFVVSITGQISDIEITRSVDPLLDNEVVKALKKMPEFKPGMQRLKPVPVYYSAFVNFKLQ